VGFKLILLRLFPMSSTLIEQTRCLHQELEMQLGKTVEDLLTESKTTKDRVRQEHRIKARLDILENTSKQILETYQDETGARRDELASMEGEEVFDVFYDKLKDVREYHRRFPNLQPPEEMEIKAKGKFSGAEWYGAFLDLNTYYERCVNLSFFPKYDSYSQFLEGFGKFDSIPKRLKLLHHPQYNQYLCDLRDYLVGFQARTSPLVDVTELVAIVEEDFANQWKSEKVAGWFVSEDEAAGVADEDKANPLYCKACKKLFSNHSSFTNHLAGRKHKKAIKDEGVKKEDPRSEDLAKTEFIISSFAELLQEVVVATSEYVIKKQTRTHEEIMADLEEAQKDDVVSESDSDEEDESKALYNPLNLPLGWDGKPIPFWLYKLHGLNIQYKCEICGGYTYRGPRAFQRHFNEWRHTYGLRCLGIDNSAHYMHITTFADAIALNEKMTKSNASSGWKPDEEEELEDDEGNVWNKKTYDDLKRQGII